MKIPETRYAKSGTLNIAYQSFGNGSEYLVVIPGWASHVEHMWTMPDVPEFLNRLASFSKVIILDRRGTGLSDPVLDMPTLEERMDDVRAVMDAAGANRASLFGISEGGPMAMVFSAMFPDRVDHLILFGTFARLVETEGYSAGIPEVVSNKLIAGLAENWGKGKTARMFYPSAANDPGFIEQWGRFERNSMGPGAAQRLLELNSLIDVRDILSTIRVNTLVLHRENDIVTPLPLGQYLTDHIEGARIVVLPGQDHIAWVNKGEDIIPEIEELVTGRRTMPEPDRILTTILFVDIVQSTEKATELGDHAWKTVLEKYYDVVRDALRLHRGVEIDTAGDGLFASFDGPARAVSCACALTQEVESLGITLRAGVHTGECEIFGEKLSGLAVHIGSRVAGEADAGEVLVSSTVKDLTVGSGIEYVDSGSHALKGVPGEWRLFRATA